MSTNMSRKLVDANRNNFCLIWVLYLQASAKETYQVFIKSFPYDLSLAPLRPNYYSESCVCSEACWEIKQSGIKLASSSEAKMAP